MLAETLAAYLTTAVIAKPVAAAADIGAACVPVAGARHSGAPEAPQAAAHSLGDTSVSVGTNTKQGKNVMSGNAAAARN